MDKFLEDDINGRFGQSWNTGVWILKRRLE